jgi:NADH-quinone oxidoreductase subunit N
MQPLAISFVLILLVGAVLALVVGIFLPRRLQTWNALLAALVLVGAAVAAALKLAAPPGLVFDDSYAVDAPALWAILALLASGLLCTALLVPAFRNDAREAELYALLLFSLLGAIMLAGANDVMEILLGVLLTSVGSYALVAYRRTSPPALEALLKYYLFGALTNIGLLYGLVLLYGLSGSTILGDIGGGLGDRNHLLLAVAAVLVVVGLGFKAGYVPAHFWIPDVYQGATVPIATFLSIVPKIAAVLALARLVAAFDDGALDLAPLIAGISAVTMTWGNIAAFVQTDIRRLLGYSTIAQAGYLLFGVVALPGSGVALPGLLYYFAAYLAANVGAFAVVASTGRFEIPDNRALTRSQPLLALAMLVSLLSLVGIPPLAGFVGKFALFVATMQAGYTWLMVLGLINSALSLFYYLRVIAPMFVPPAGAPPEPPEPIAKAVAIISAVGSIALGIGSFLLIGAGSMSATLAL